MPIKTLIYVNNNDFYESIIEIKPLSDITQLNLTNESIVYGEMKSPILKKILYNWKLLYYLYNRFSSTTTSKNAEKTAKIQPKSTNKENELRYIAEVFQLIDHVANHYNINNMILVFQSNSSTAIIEQCKHVGFNVIILDSSEDDKSWTFDYDAHWTCYGHEKAAQQVSEILNLSRQ